MPGLEQRTGLFQWVIGWFLPESSTEEERSAGWVEEQVAGSLERLGIRQLHAVLLHRPEQLFDSHGERLLDALEGIMERG